MPPGGLPTVPLPPSVKMEDDEASLPPSIMGLHHREPSEERTVFTPDPQNVPLLIQEIMDVEHLWFSTRPGGLEKHHSAMAAMEEISSEENMVQTLTNMADKRLFKLVKWCKSLPLFKNILVRILKYRHT